MGPGEGRTLARVSACRALVSPVKYGARKRGHTGQHPTQIPDRSFKEGYLGLRLSVVNGRNVIQDILHNVVQPHDDSRA